MAALAGNRHVRTVCNLAENWSAPIRVDNELSNINPEKRKTPMV
jgi:hypothetical protein